MTHSFFFSITQALDMKQIKVGGENTPAHSSSTATKLSTFSRLFLWSTHLLYWFWKNTIHVVLTCEITLNSTQIFYFLFVYFISVGKFHASIQNVIVLNGVSRSERYILYVIHTYFIHTLCDSCLCLSKQTKRII